MRCRWMMSDKPGVSKMLRSSTEDIQQPRLPDRCHQRQACRRLDECGLRILHDRAACSRICTAVWFEFAVQRKNLWGSGPFMDGKTDEEIEKLEEQKQESQVQAVQMKKRKAKSAGLGGIIREEAPESDSACYEESGEDPQW